MTFARLGQMPVGRLVDFCSAECVCSCEEVTRNTASPPSSAAELRSGLFSCRDLLIDRLRSVGAGDLAHAEGGPFWN